MAIQLDNEGHNPDILWATLSFMTALLAVAAFFAWAYVW
jgi:hypothetical protein